MWIDADNIDKKEQEKSINKIAKNRDGATGVVSYDFDMGIGYFSEVVGENYLVQSKSNPTGNAVKEEKGQLEFPDINY